MKSSLKTLALVGLAMISASAWGQEPSADRPLADRMVELAYRLHDLGTRKPIQIQQRNDLGNMLQKARSLAIGVNLDCEVASVSEIHWIQDEIESIGGYEVAADCEDSPIGFYFDVNQRYLARIELAR
jgi:hypothetical protein